MQLDRCFAHKGIWRAMSAGADKESQINVCRTIQEALEIITDIKDNNHSAHINVLFTGSLHLVGGALGLLNSQADMKVVKASKRLRS